MRFTQMMKNPMFKRGFYTGLRAAQKVVNDAEWNEEDHPRNPDGTFGTGGGESSSGGEEPEYVGASFLEKWAKMKEQEAKEQEDRAGKAIRMRELNNMKDAAVVENNRDMFLQAMKMEKERGIDYTDKALMKEFEKKEEEIFNQFPQLRPSQEKLDARDAMQNSIMKSLTPKELREVYPYCKGRSDEELEGYFDVKDVSEAGSGLSPKEYKEMATRGFAMQEKCTWDKIDRLENPLSENEIIDKLAFKDNEGFCVSLAQAYLLNKAGYDVQDGKDPKSGDYFARYGRSHLQAYANAENIEGYTASGIIESLKEKVNPGEEYFFVAYHHAAAVRKNDAGQIQFLELQGRKKEENGWKELTAGNMPDRFGGKRASITSAKLINGKDLTDNPDYIKYAGYLNNPTNMKGSGKSNVDYGAEMSYKDQMKEYNKQKKQAMKEARAARVAKTAQTVQETPKE